MTDQPLDVEGVYDELRHAILEKIRRDEQSECSRDNHQICEGNEVKSLLSNHTIYSRNKLQIDALVCQIYHELYLEHIIIPGEAKLDRGATHPMNWPFFQVTQHGQRVLQTLEYSPYDPTGYVRRLKSEISDIDETIVRYIEESLKCLRTDCLLAAAVTIGCASEQAMLLLIEKYGQAITDPQKKKEYEKDTSHWTISRKYKAFRKSLDGITHKLPKDLSNPLEQQLNAVFDLIRRTRNDAGHPTGEPVTRRAVLANHIVFQDYCKYVYSLMDYFTERGVKL